MGQIFAKDMWLERWAQLRHKDFVHRVCKESNHPTIFGVDFDKCDKSSSIASSQIHFINFRLSVQTQLTQGQDFLPKLQVPSRKGCAPVQPRSYVIVGPRVTEWQVETKVQIWWV